MKSSEIWSWRKMQKIIWTDHVRNEKVLQRLYINYQLDSLIIIYS